LRLNLRSAAGVGVPQRSASAAIEQFLLGEVQVATVIDAEATGHEAQLVGPLGYFSLCRKHIDWHLATSLSHQRRTFPIFARSHVNAVSLRCHP
jgi:hypothetical protein